AVAGRRVLAHRVAPGGRAERVGELELDDREAHQRSDLASACASARRLRYAARNAVNSSAKTATSTTSVSTSATGGPPIDTASAACTATVGTPASSSVCDR